MRRPLSVLVIAWLALAATVAIGQRPTTIPVEEIRPGMTGYGLTVLRGRTPERFDVEVIDVLHNFRPDQHLILIRCDHPRMREAVTIGGASGSPIFIDGRLAGAYAYGWPFGTEPVIGVTPIGSMLDDMRVPIHPEAFPGSRPIAKRPARRPRRAAIDPARSPRLAGLPAYMGGNVSALDPLAAHARRLGLGGERDPAGLVRTSTPLMLGGMTEPVAAMLGELLRPFGLEPLQGGGAGEGNDAPDRFIDGGPIGVQLVRGHMSATAIGTVTHVGNDRLVAFGHPMMQAGEIGLPTTTARILHVLANAQRSFKIGEADERPLGTLINDRQASIVVDPALQAAAVPVTLRLHGLPGLARNEWRMEVASHRALTPVFAFAALVNAIKAAQADQTDVLYRAVMRVGVEGHGTIALEDRGAMNAGPGDATELGGLRMFRVIEAAFGNPFEESRITGIELDLHVEFSRDYYEVVAASVGEEEVDPGSVANVHVVLRRHGQPDIVRIVPVAIPQSAAGQTVDIELEPGPRVDLEQPEPRSLQEMLDNIQRGYPADALVVSLKMPTRGLQFRGHIVRELPGSALDALHQATRPGDVRPFVTYRRQAIDVGRVIAGSARVQLRVREEPRE